MELIKGHTSLAQISINDIHSDKQSLREELELKLHDYQPVDEGLALFCRKMPLANHVICSWLVDKLGLFYTMVNTVCVTEILVLDEKAGVGPIRANVTNQLVDRAFRLV